MNTFRPIDRLSFAMLLGSAVLCSPLPAAAQQMDPHMQMPMPETQPAPAAKPTPKKSHNKHTPAARTAPAKAAIKRAMDHDTMGHGEAMPPEAPSKDKVDHSGMDMSMPMDDMSPDMPMDRSVKPGMSMAPTQPREPIPVITDADRTAAQPPPHDHPVHDNSIQHYTLVDRLETWNSSQGGALEWDIRNWNGTDLDRLWLRSEGARVDGRTQNADVEVLYGRSVATWWDVVAGIRHDSRPGSSQDFAAFGVVGVAPYKFDVEATAYVGQSGQTAVRLAAEYEALLTNRLILQPRVEANLFGKDDARRGIGSGLGTIEAGLRLRYEITRRFAPYIGVVYERSYGDTARIRQGEGNDSRDTQLVAGIRIWF